MDNKRFDELVKRFGAAGEPRRTFLKRTVGGALAAFVALRGGKAGAQPGCRREGHPCEGNQECCPGLECRVTGPGNARRCAAPPQKSPPKKSPPKKSPPKKSPPY
jgi:hypothetical protein